MICNTQQKHGIQSQTGSLRRREQWTHIHRATRFPRSRSVRQREQWLATLGATHSPHNRRRQDCSCSKNQPAAERARTHYTTQSRLSLIACPPANQFNGHCVEQVLSPHECIMVGRSSKRPQVHWRFNSLKSMDHTSY